MFETLVDGKPIRSPDHYAVTTPGAPGQPVAFEVRRSKGFEGMAQSPDGRFLYALLEGPIWKPESGGNEQVAGQDVLRILEFDVAKEAWTGRSWFYPLAQKSHAIGDFNMIDATTGLIIERDNGEGTADKACPAGQKGPDCFHDIAKFKRVVKIEMNEANVGKPVRQIGYIDLMKIADPDHKAKQGAIDGVLPFPFFTIENVDVVDRATSSSSATTTTCPSPRRAIRRRPMTTSWCCSPSRSCWRRNSGRDAQAVAAPPWLALQIRRLSGESQRSLTRQRPHSGRSALQV